MEKETKEIHPCLPVMRNRVMGDFYALRYALVYFKNSYDKHISILILKILQQCIVFETDEKNLK